MAPERQLLCAHFMKLFFSVLFFLSASLAWGQSSTVSLPTSFSPPPPPSPAAIQNMGSLQFQVFRNNMFAPQSYSSSGSGMNALENSISTPNSAQLLKVKSAQSTVLPKSFESSIQGLQFIKPSPLQP